MVDARFGGFLYCDKFVVSPGQMMVIPVVTVEGAEVSIHTFGAIDKGMLMLLVFLTCNEHLVEMLAVFLAYKVVMQDERLASSCRGA